MKITYDGNYIIQDRTSVELCNVLLLAKCPFFDRI